MTILSTLKTRSNNQCELCGSPNAEIVFAVSPKPGTTDDECVLLCPECHEQLTDQQKFDPTHWFCLHESAWSPVPAVQVLAWRILDHLKPTEPRAQDLQDQLFLDDETKTWATNTPLFNNTPQHQDANGTPLHDGDKVTLIKDLPVKGANFTAKIGTTVRRISLVADTPEHIEGKVNDQKIVILTKYVKKCT